MTNLVLPSPIERCYFDFGCQTYVKRDDLIHSEISGNKYRKLKYIMNYLVESGAKGIITFGGSFSNHIYSTAAFSKLLGIESVGIIRGEDDETNPTLKFVRSKGMKLHFLPRSEYRLKPESTAINTILRSYQEFDVIEEGGEHPLAYPGLKEIVDEMEQQNMIPDYIAVSAGTGTTSAGILRTVCDKKWKTRVIVVSPMKNGMLEHKIISNAGPGSHSDQLIFIDEYAGKGYAKVTEDLILFMHEFYLTTGIKLDQIYTAKLVYGLWQLSRRGFFSSSDKLIWIHTGGLQGLDGYNYLMSKFGNKNLIHYR